jgi:hypothetical protein
VPDPHGEEARLRRLEHEAGYRHIVIASEAKQSSFLRRDKDSWIASSLRSSQ